MNQDTEKKGLEAVVAYEKANGRTARRVQKCGYDLSSTGKDSDSDRHIEVKATAKPYFTSRWLEELEWSLAQADKCFYLYLVTDARSEKPRIFEFSGSDLMKRRPRIVCHYLFDFKKADFQQRPRLS